MICCGSLNKTSDLVVFHYFYSKLINNPELNCGLNAVNGKEASQKAIKLLLYVIHHQNLTVFVVVVSSLSTFVDQIEPCADRINEL